MTTKPRLHVIKTGPSPQLQDAGNGGGEPPMDITQRVENLETKLDKVVEKLVHVEMDVAVIKSNYATKADTAKLETKIEASKNSIIMWVVGAIFLAQLLPMLKDWVSTSRNPAAAYQALPPQTTNP